jgi:small conductance mechanosensitive channel
MKVDFHTPWTQLQHMVNGFIAALPRLLFALVIFCVVYLLARLIKRAVTRIAREAHLPFYGSLVLGRVSQWVVVLLGLLIGLSIAVPTFKAGDLIQLLGITSVAIGFAFRDILQNFLAGIILLLTQPFRIGDQVVVSGFEGRVEDIQTRATMIRTYDGRRIVIPNSTVFMQEVTVNTAFPARRSEYDLGIGYSDDLDLAKSVAVAAMREVPGVLHEPPPDALLIGLDESTIGVRIRWWTESSRADVLMVQDRVLGAVNARLTSCGIDQPFPTQQILFHDQTEETDGDRARQREGWPAGGGTPPRSNTIAGALRSIAQACARGQTQQERQPGSESRRIHGAGPDEPRQKAG